MEKIQRDHSQAMRYKIINIFGQQTLNNWCFSYTKQTRNKFNKRTHIQYLVSRGFTHVRKAQQNWNYNSRIEKKEDYKNKDSESEF